MTLSSSIAFLRRTHEAKFSCEVLVQRVVAPGTFDETTGLIGSPTLVEIYSGPGEVRTTRLQGIGTDVVTGERELRFERSEARLPHDTPIVKDDLLTVLASAHDQGLVGVAYRITDVLLEGYQTVRKCVIERVDPVIVEEESS